MGAGLHGLVGLVILAATTVYLVWNASMTGPLEEMPPTGTMTAAPSMMEEEPPADTEIPAAAHEDADKAASSADDDAGDAAGDQENPGDTDAPGSDDVGGGVDVGTEDERSAGPLDLEAIAGAQAFGAPAMPLVIDARWTTSRDGTVLVDRLLVSDLVEGAGPAVSGDDRVTMEFAFAYQTDDGELVVYDSSAQRKRAHTIDLLTPDLPGAIRLGVPQMRVGGVRVIESPPAWGYGADGRDPVPGGASQRLVVRVVGVQPAQAL